MHQRGRLFVLMVTELPTVMNSRDDAPRAASIAHSHRRWMEIGPGGEAKEVHTCLRLLWTHMDAGISAHAHTERESEGECVCVLGSGCIDIYGCLLLTGPKMIFLWVTVWSI